MVMVPMQDPSIFIQKVIQKREFLRLLVILATNNILLVQGKNLNFLISLFPQITKVTMVLAKKIIMVTKIKVSHQIKR